MSVQLASCEELAARSRADLGQRLAGLEETVQGALRPAVADLEAQGPELLRLRADLQRQAAELERWRAELSAQGAEVSRWQEGHRLQGDEVARWQAAVDELKADFEVQGLDVQRLRDALSGDCGRYLRFVDEERRRSSDITVEGDHAEWLVRDVLSWRQALPRGKALESPEFGLRRQGGAYFEGLRLRFFPSGGKNAAGEDACSLYLVHPPAMPWAQFELSVGGHVQPLDSLFGGTDDFCELSPQLEELDGAQCALLRVRFLPPSKSPKRMEASAVRVDPRSPSPLAPITAGHLWQQSNRREVA